MKNKAINSIRFLCTDYAQVVIPEEVHDWFWDMHSVGKRSEASRRRAEAAMMEMCKTWGKRNLTARKGRK